MLVKGTPKECNFYIMCSPGYYFDATFVAYFDIGIIYVSTKITFPSHPHYLHLYSFYFTPLLIFCLFLYLFSSLSVYIFDFINISVLVHTDSSWH